MEKGMSKRTATRERYSVCFVVCGVLLWVVMAGWGAYGCGLDQRRSEQPMSEGASEAVVDTTEVPREPILAEERGEISTPDEPLEESALSEPLLPDAAPSEEAAELASEGAPQEAQPEALAEALPEAPPSESLPESNAPSHVLFLYDEDTDRYLTPLQGTIDLGLYANNKMLNLALQTTGGVASVVFTFNQEASRTENTAVFTAFVGGTDHRSRLTAGSHRLQAVLYSGTRATGQVVARLTANFTIQAAAPVEPTPSIPGNPRTVPPNPTFTQTRDVTSTIVISQPGVYDYQNVLHIWRGSGSCNQTENQPHILRIAASNVTVKNFAYRNAPDGIHIATCGTGQGNTCTGTIRNIMLDNITGWTCEDALTTGKGTSDITIQNSFFMGNPNTNFRDKILQLNFANNLKIYNTIFKDSPRMVRFKSGSTITLKFNRFYNFTQAVRGDTYQDITGIIPNVPAVITSEGNHFQDGDRAFSVMGRVTVNSLRDTFHNVRRQKEEIDGAVVNIR
jgi:hypothetical protein